VPRTGALRPHDAPAHLLTCDPDNLASRRTIELLGALFIDELLVPPNDPHYARGSKTKLRFQWTP
jgi:tagatose 1,6-diphosphate aldolase